MHETKAKRDSINANHRNVEPIHRYATGCFRQASLSRRPPFTAGPGAELWGFTL